MNDGTGSHITSVKTKLADIARRFAPQLGVDCELPAAGVVAYCAGELVTTVAL